MKAELASKKCVPCDGDTPPLNGEELRRMAAQLDGNWKVIGEERLEKQFKFPDFRQALHFTNRIGVVAEQQGHHPDIYLTYGEVRVQLWTHRVSGLTESDFILAAKIDDLD